MRSNGGLPASLVLAPPGQEGRFVAQTRALYGSAASCDLRNARLMPDRPDPQKLLPQTATNAVSATPQEPWQGQSPVPPSEPSALKQRTGALATEPLQKTSALFPRRSICD